MFWKLFKSASETPAPASQEPITAPHTLPLAFLKGLIPIGDLPNTELVTLKIQQRRYSPGQIIFNLGDSADSLIYLCSGHVYLEAANGNGYNIEEGTFKACYPLSSHSEHHFSAIAKTQTEIIYLPLPALQRSSQAAAITNPLVNQQETPPALIDSKLFQGFCAAYQDNELRVPSLPDIAIRLRQALYQDIGIADAAKIINLDPAIASKLIQVANSPLYRTVNPIARCHDAINRLGLKTTQNLVTSISLHNLFRSQDKRLRIRVQQLWKQSIQIASLSYTLAELSKTINPDEALLAGLTFNIGALPIITYAESLGNDEFSESELDATIDLLQGQVGCFILSKWHFPEHLQTLPNLASHWYYDAAPNLQISDIVLLARYHAQLGTGHKQKLPPLNTLPAFLKLGDNSLTPDMSLKALHDAKQQIAEAISFFRS